MNIRRLLVVPLCLAAISAWGQQPTTPNGAASDATNRKVHQLDLLVKLVPLTLKKDQFQTLIAALEEARKLLVKEQTDEDKILADLDPSLTDAVKNAVEKGIYPPRDFQVQVQSTFDKMVNKQLNVQYAMLKIVSTAINSSLNEGQKKVMEGSYDEKFINPANPSSVTPEIKLEFYEKSVFLDPETYGLLIDMAKHVS